MRLLFTICAMLIVVSPLLAFDLGARKPGKADVVYPQHTPDPARQGGDTILDAFAIDLPFSGSGTTVGYTDDYDEACPYTGSTSPDVIYTMTPTTDEIVDIDLLGSAYDTKLYLYDENLSLVACNDDFYSDYVSKLEQVTLAGGTQYFVVIDGYGGDAGDYVIAIDEYEPCIVECHPDAELEGEPPLVNGYEDYHNGGCNSSDLGVTPFGTISEWLFCGKSGWYIASDGSQLRDTDWYELTVPASGHIVFFGDAEYATYLFELGPPDCDNVAVIQNVTIGPCLEGHIDIYGTPGDTVWFWVGPTTFDGSGEYTYVLHGEPGTATESHSWSEVKSLFD